MALEDDIRELTAAVRELISTLRPLPRPKPFTVQLISERRENEMDFLTYEATLPAVPAGTDVVEQRLTIGVDGTPRDPLSLAKDATTATFEVPQGSSVTLSLVYVDDGDNVSAPREQSFTALDTIAPDAPGEFGEIRLVSERREE